MTDRIDTLRRAASLLRADAESSRYTHTRPPEFSDWTGEPDAHADYLERTDLAGKLVGLADEIEHEEANAKP
ncbi:MAG TPA: hypothetical protein VF389_02700 [Woeseiaceae bacterium]